MRSDGKSEGRAVAEPSDIFLEERSWRGYNEMTAGQVTRCVALPATENTDMTKLQESQLGGVSRANEARAYGRRKLASMAYVELGQDNGGILLNVGEGGLAIQSALTLTCQDLPKIRFQLPQYQGWITASGKVAWMSPSKTEAGIQFTDVPEEALTEIRRWVSGEGEPSEARDERPRVLASVGPERKSVGREAIRQPVRSDEREPVEIPAIPPVNEFRFNEHSMFAPDPRIENLWVDNKPRRSWGAIALLGLLFAALFFVLGAAIGPAGLQQWMDRGLAFVGAARQSRQEAAPATTQQAAPSAQNATGAGTPEGSPSNNSSSSAPTKDLAKGPDSSQAANSSRASEAGAANPGSANAGGAESTGAARTESSSGPKTEEDTNAGGESGTEKGGELAIDPAPRAAVPASKQSTPKLVPSKRAAERYSSAGVGRIPDLRSDAPDTSHQSLLVSAPAPGAPAMVIGLSNEAVSASASVAISARRSIRVPPRATAAYSRSERVIIGKLLSHSDPFYPMEARNKRIDGVVELRATIGRAGGIINLMPIRGPEVLTTAAITAVREWRYEPTFLDGDPVETQADIILVFRLP
jgi:TonB family protein